MGTLLQILITTAAIIASTLYTYRNDRRKKFSRYILFVTLLSALVGALFAWRTHVESDLNEKKAEVFHAKFDEQMGSNLRTSLTVRDSLSKELEITKNVIVQGDSILAKSNKQLASNSQLFSQATKTLVEIQGLKIPIRNIAIGFTLKGYFPNYLTPDDVDTTLMVLFHMGSVKRSFEFDTTKKTRIKPTDPNFYERQDFKKREWTALTTATEHALTDSMMRNGKKVKFEIREKAIGNIGLIDSSINNKPIYKHLEGISSYRFPLNILGEYSDHQEISVNFYSSTKMPKAINCNVKVRPDIELVSTNPNFLAEGYITDVTIDYEHERIYCYVVLNLRLLRSEHSIDYLSELTDKIVEVKMGTKDITNVKLVIGSNNSTYIPLYPFKSKDKTCKSELFKF